MAGRDTFIVYAGWEEPLMELSDEERGKALACMFEYNRTGELPEIADATTRVVVKMIVRQMDNNNQRYEERCRKNAENINKRWKSNCDSDTNVYDRIRNDTNVYLYDNENDNDIDNENVNVIGKDNKDNGKDKEKQNPPSQARPSVTRAAKVGKDDNEKGSADGAEDNGDDPDPIMKYGSYNNVPMTRSEYEALMAEYGKDALRYLDDLSQNIALAGKTFDNPSEYIRDWMKRNGIKPVSERAPKDMPMPKGYELLKQRARFV